MAITIASSRGGRSNVGIDTYVTTTGSTWNLNSGNATDGNAGTNTNTYATVTAVASGTTPTIKVGAYFFNPDNIFSTLDASNKIFGSPVLNSVRVTARGFVNTANRWSAPTVQAFLDTVALGSPVSLGSWTTTVASYTVTLSGVTMDNILDDSFSIRLSLPRQGGTTDSASVDFLDVLVNYSYENWGSLTI